MREIEIKLRVRDLKAVQEQLASKGCHLSEPIKQHDVIYTKGGSTKERSASKEGDIIMRIRRQNDQAILTFKEQKSNELDNLEFETQIEDPETMHKILLVLGFVPGVEVKKVRRKSEINGCEICLDDVEGLGTFIEFEKLVPDGGANPMEVAEELFTLAESLGISRENEEKLGYDSQIFQKLHGK